MLKSPLLSLGAVAALFYATSAAAQSRSPEPNYDGRNVSFELSGGSTLRGGDRLTDRLLVTVWQRSTVKGTGTCSANACPITYNGEEMFARRSRLTVLSGGDDNRGNRGGSGTDRNSSSGSGSSSDRDRSNSDNRYPAGWVRLQRGDRGDKVKQLQEMLVRDGARLTPDGNFGRTTEAAIRDIQRRRRLKVDGVAGYDTLRALGV